VSIKRTGPSGCLANVSFKMKNMKKKVIVLSLLCVFFLALIYKCCIVSNSDYSYNEVEKDIVVLSKAEQFSGRISLNNRHSSEKDVIPQKDLAVKIALLLLESIYGKNIYEEKPYRVALLDSVWVVETSCMPPTNTDNSKVESDMELETIICGGVGHVEMNKHTGEIYSIYHTK